MVSYPHRCNDCGKDFNHEAEYHNYLMGLYVTCPHCGSKDTRRVIEIPSTVIYKGRGFTKQTKGSNE